MFVGPAFNLSYVMGHPKTPRPPPNPFQDLKVLIMHSNQYSYIQSSTIMAHIEKRLAYMYPTSKIEIYTDRGDYTPETDAWERLTHGKKIVVVFDLVDEDAYSYDIVCDRKQVLIISNWLRNFGESVLYEKSIPLLIQKYATIQNQKMKVLWKNRDVITEIFVCDPSFIPCIAAMYKESKTKMNISFMDFVQPNCNYRKDSEEQMESV
eukprot:189985_1